MLTLKYLRYWHTRFNKLVFDGKLTRVPIEIKRLGGNAGLCYGIRIEIDAELDNRAARSVLLHEMVHQWQHESKLPMDHGRSFTQWEEPCTRLTGLSLYL